MGTIRQLGEALILLVILFLVLAIISMTGAADDQYEENDDMAHAFPLEPGVYADLNATDTDCFSVNITTTGILRITLWYEAVFGFADLALFSESGSELSASNSHTGEEHVEIDVTTGERYFLEVTNGTGITYHLAIVNGNSDSWIFAVYMDGDNTLHENMEPDLVEMRAVGSGGGLHIPVLKDGSGSKDTKIVYVMEGLDIELPPYVVNQSWGKEVNMGEPAVLGEWFAWSLTTFDSGGRTALDLWDHGKGVWGVCWDANSGNNLLTLADIREGIEISGAGTIELLGSDSCLMQVLELSYEVDGLANHFIASQEDEPKDGWDYEPFLLELSGNLTWDGEQLGRSIIRAYIAEYGVDGDETLSVVSLRNITDLSDSLADLAGYFRENMTLWADEIRMARDDTRDYNYYYVDVLDFLQNMEKRTDDVAILTLVAFAIDEIERTILHEEHGAKRYNSNGLSLYFPKSGYDNDYDDITFSVDTGWGEFLKDWIQTPGGPSDHFDRVLSYPLNNDTFPGNDTVLVKVKPYTDQEEENVTILVELVRESEGSSGRDPDPPQGPTFIINLTIRESSSGFVDFYLSLVGNEEAGNYTAHASLFDSEGNRDDLWVSEPFHLLPYDIEPPLPAKPSIAINPDSPQPIIIHEAGTLELTVKVYAGIPTSFFWDIDGDNLTDVITATGILLHHLDEPGELFISVLASDDWNQTERATIQIRVNAIPVFLNDQVHLIAGPGLIDIALNATDPDGEIVWYDWSIDGTPIWSGAKAENQPTAFRIEGLGNHSVRLVVTDSDGGIASHNVTVLVNAFPTITFTGIMSDRRKVQMNRVQYHLTTRANDTDGKIADYRWDADGDGFYELSSETGEIIVYIPYGVTTIGFQVIDDRGFSNETIRQTIVWQEPEIRILREDLTPIDANTSVIQSEADSIKLTIIIQMYVQPDVNDIQVSVWVNETELHTEKIRHSGWIDKEVMVVTIRESDLQPTHIRVSGEAVFSQREISVEFIGSDDRNGSDDVDSTIFLISGVILTGFCILGFLLLESRGKPKWRQK